MLLAFSLLCEAKIKLSSYGVKYSKYCKVFQGQLKFSIKKINRLNLLKNLFCLHCRSEKIGTEFQLVKFRMYSLVE